MTLDECVLNANCKVINIDIADLKLKYRLQEIGFFRGSELRVLKKSGLKKTLLIKTLDSCFAIKLDMASQIQVEYE